MSDITEQAAVVETKDINFANISKKEMRKMLPGLIDEFSEYCRKGESGSCDGCPFDHKTAHEFNTGCINLTACMYLWFYCRGLKDMRKSWHTNEGVGRKRGELRTSIDEFLNDPERTEMVVRCESYEHCRRVAARVHETIIRTGYPLYARKKGKNMYIYKKDVPEYEFGS